MTLSRVANAILEGHAFVNKTPELNKIVKAPFPCFQGGLYVPKTFITNGVGVQDSNRRG